MAVRREANFPLIELIPILESRGWDAELNETLVAEKIDGFGHWRLVLDKGGRVALQLTALAGEAHGKTIHRIGHTFAIQREKRFITYVTTTLDTAEAFDEILSEMIRLARRSLEKPPG